MKRTYINIGYTNLFDKTDKLRYKFIKYGKCMKIGFMTRTLIPELQYARRIIDYK